MADLDPEADSDTCAALCRVAAGFKKSADHAFSKPAGKNCHLRDDSRIFVDAVAGARERSPD